jgi:putative transposase
MNRGDRRELIFIDDADRQRFVDTLGEACAKTGWQVHAYVLMPNHFHWVVETPQPNLVAGMKWLLGTYTSRFNRRHKLFGHLFSGRYKSLIVDGSGNGYLKSVGDYVHSNPVRANLVAADVPLQSFAWSSWPAYLLAPSKRPTWLRVDRLLGAWGIPEDSPAGRQRLERALEERRGAEETKLISKLGPRGI